MGHAKESQTENVSADFIHRYDLLQSAQSRLLESVGLDNLSLSQFRKLAGGTCFISKEAHETIEVTHDYVYEILSGYVAVYDQASRPRSLLAWRVPGDLLGDFYFINPGAVSDVQDVFVVTDSCRLLRFDVGILRQLIESHSTLIWFIAQQLARKAINSRIRVRIRSHKVSHTQVAQLFLELINERGVGGKEGNTLKGTYTYFDFEDFLGCSYSSVANGCLALINSGCIEHYDENPNSRQYNILDIGKLRSIANSEKKKGNKGTN